MARLGLLAVAVAAAVAAAVWYTALRDTAEPVNVEGVVTEFRENDPSGESPVPEGVYVYDTVGEESTDALTGVTHRYPQQSTITVTRDPCGVRMRWDVLKGRSTTWTFCLTADGWMLEAQDERHTFFGRTERTEYDCFGLVFRPDGDRREVTEALCTADSTEEFTKAHVAGRETIAVGSESSETVHLRRTSVFSGKIRGDARHDVWLDRATGVPVRIEMRSRTTNDSPIGDVVYEEDVTLRLTSLTPRR